MPVLEIEQNEAVLHPSDHYAPQNAAGVDAGLHQVYDLSHRQKTTKETTGMLLTHVGMLWWVTMRRKTYSGVQITDVRTQDLLF